MCGIAGFYSSEVFSDEYNKSLMLDMCGALRHRGPDQNGIFIDEATGVTLGHTRLSIHDLSESGKQPMVSHCGRYVMVFNGEIYNYRDLRRYISKSRAVVWKGKSDTEILLELISLVGFKVALTKLNGMFAFALFDRETKSLHIARDKFGEKPVYLYQKGHTIAFASELKAIEQTRQTLTINQQAVNLLLRYSYVPAPYSIYREVTKLLPGQSISIFINKNRLLNRLEPETYWCAKAVARECASKQNKSQSIEHAIENVESALSESIVEKLDADVPVGAFLSGGIDSTCVVALMQKHSNKKVKTFSIGFNDRSYNEAHHAKEVASHLGTEHHEMYLDPKDMLHCIPKLGEVYDEPFADSSQLPTYIVSKFAKEHVTVALTGDSGDELFGGYNRHVYAEKLEGMITSMPYSLRRNFSRILSSIPKTSYDRICSAMQMASFNKLSIQRLGDKAYKFAGAVGARDGKELYHRLTQTSVNLGSDLNLIDESIFGEPSYSLAEKMMLQDTISYMQHDILTKVDRASMANSLETRVPFLDERVYKAAWSIPIGLKIHNGMSKFPLRKITSKYVPDELMNRPKAGFGVPIDTWLREDLRDWAESLLTNEKLESAVGLDSRVVRLMWSEHLSNKRNAQYELWNVLMYLQWLEKK